MTNTNLTDVTDKIKDAAETTGDFIKEKAHDAVDALQLQKDRARQEAEEKMEEVQAVSFEKKQQFEEAARDALQAAKLKFDELREGAEDSTERVRDETRLLRAKAQSQLQDARRKLDELKVASADSWDYLRLGFIASYRNLQAACDEIQVSEMKQTSSQS
tara:strand:+ start:3749 stop:4228 length:480 start_codon:yes stop_codon:yes gene_type:complete